MPNEFAPATIVPKGGDKFDVQYGNDKGLYVEFDTMAEYMEFESTKQGKAVHQDVEIIRIFIPGKMQPTIRKVLKEDTPHQPSDLNRWPKQYEAFKNKMKLAPEGYALEAWSVLTKSDVLNLKAYNIHTVEQLSQVPDNVAQDIAGGNTLRAKAQAFLKTSTDATAMMKIVKENEDLKGDVAALKKQLETINAKLGKDKS